MSDLNAQAGPSHLFLPPPLAHPQPPTFLAGTDDLLSRFQLLAAYDTHVRPYAPPVGTALVGAPLDALSTSGPGAIDKGKGKERTAGSAPAQVATPGPGVDGGDGEEGGAGKKKNNYRHLIRSMPGKHSMKKDDYLVGMMQVPPKQRVAIQPFDERTQREAFTVTLEGLKGFNISVLVGESAQAKEDRKKRKELKRLAKTGMPTPAGPSPVATHPPTPATGPAQAATPRPSFVRANSRPQAAVPPPAQPTTTSRAGTPKAGMPRTGTPAPVPPPTAAASAPAPPPPVVSAPPTTLAPAPPRSVPRPAPTVHPLPARPVGASVEPPRGLKRDRDDVTPAPPLQHASQHSVGTANGYSSGVRQPGVPRPIKKQRMDSHGFAREMPVQQPTPQGV